MNNKILIIVLSALLFLSVSFIVWQNFIKKDKKDSSDPQNTVDETVLDANDSEEREEGSEKEEELTVNRAERLIIGSWQSEDDELSVVHFNADGEVHDVYAGGAVSESGTYQIFDSLDFLNEEERELALNLESSGIFLRQTFGQENYDYVILKMDVDTLELSYLSRGNTLRYKKVD